MRRRNVLPGCAAPWCSARRRDSTRLWYVRFLDSTINVVEGSRCEPTNRALLHLWTCLAWNRFTRTTKHVYACQQPRMKSEQNVMNCRLNNNLSSPKPGHTSGGSGRGARRGGGAGSGRTGCQQNCSPRRQGSALPSKASTKRRLNVFPEARTSEILFKPNAGTKSMVDERFTSGLSAVHHRDEKRFLFPAADQWTDAFLSL